VRVGVDRFSRDEARQSARLSNIRWWALDCALREAGPQGGARVCLAMLEDMLPPFERDTRNRSYRRALRLLQGRVEAWGTDDRRIPRLRDYGHVLGNEISISLLRLDISIPPGHETGYWRYHCVEILAYMIQTWGLALTRDDPREHAYLFDLAAVELQYRKAMMAADLLDAEIADALCAGSATTNSSMCAPRDDPGDLPGT